MPLPCSHHAKMQMASSSSAGLHSGDQLYVSCSPIAQQLRPKLTHPAACIGRTHISETDSWNARVSMAMRMRLRLDAVHQTSNSFCCHCFPKLPQHLPLAPSLISVSGKARQSTF